MSQAINFPPEFPKEGRLPLREQHEMLVVENLEKQNELGRNYRNELCLAAGKRVMPPCCRTLHISLFFDGTSNNLFNDQYRSDPKHPTNIARLFNASIGAGYAGGVPEGQSNRLFDNAESLNRDFFKYYIPGIGSPFPEINEDDYTTFGLANGDGGEERINWGLISIIDALKQSLINERLETHDYRGALLNMGTNSAVTSPLLINRIGKVLRRDEFTRQLGQLKYMLSRSLLSTGNTMTRLLGIKLYVYGFSRGAASARAFVTWLNQLLQPPSAEQTNPYFALGDLKLPISVEFLGLFDTVASVGVPYIAPFAGGHMGWADDSLALPPDSMNLVKNCVHMVAAHEQRLCFPLDSIRRSNGNYPANSVEVVYPGVHSDVGGGYPPNDQGKATQDNLLLSQIPLNDMYAAAFNAGAPLKVPLDALPQHLQKDKWRQLRLDLLAQFNINPVLTNRFNAWRSLTLGVAPTEGISEEDTATYQPVLSENPITLEQAMQKQIAWLTAWRIGRYAKGSMQNTIFYYRSPNMLEGTEAYYTAKQEREELQSNIEAMREAEKKKWSIQGNKSGDFVSIPNYPDFEPDNAKSQLVDAAKEFRQDYQGGQIEYINQSAKLLLNSIPEQPLYLRDSQNIEKAYFHIKAQGEEKVKILFPPQGEDFNAEGFSGLLRSLFDDQVHDSRAWFLYNSPLKQREPLGGYFQY
ncbi:MAG: T6SS phospholipase effector Tle1-like catalytic domain-containing protein [Vibrio sp.]